MLSPERGGEALSSYYNEFDPKAAAWLRQLIAAKCIPDGEVDERSIEDVRPSDLRGFTQCHFFAGIGGWPEGLQLAGWPTDRAVWTGSCPCQSFSAAGTRTGFDDKRHLWPAWFHLIAECRPPVVFGEQVDAAVRYGWLDLVQADMEAIGYAIGSAVLPAAGVGAPHGRHRLWFVADSLCESGERGTGSIPGTQAKGGRPRQFDGDLSLGSSDGGEVGGLDIAPSGGRERIRYQPAHGESVQAGPVNGAWRAADWIYCRDDKWRPVEPGTFPLAHGIPARVGRLRGYGNALVPQVAAEVIRAYSSLSREGGG
jgi:DNA (cytosine-5)-methyltransferase 1